MEEVKTERIGNYWVHNFPPIEGLNKSGLTPVGTTVLILPVEIEEQTKGGIVLPEISRDRESQAQTYATIVAVGQLFCYDEPFPRARPGQLIKINRFAGHIHIGEDEKEYRSIDDKEVLMLAKKVFDQRIKARIPMKDREVVTA